MVTKEMLHAERDDADIIGARREPSAAGANGNGAAGEHEEYDPLGRFDFVRGVGKDFEDWPAADKAVPGLREQFEQHTDASAQPSGSTESNVNGIEDETECPSGTDLMSRLARIRIKAPRDFARNFEAYASGEKDFEDIR